MKKFSLGFFCACFLILVTTIIAIAVSRPRVMVIEKPAETSVPDMYDDQQSSTVKNKIKEKVDDRAAILESMQYKWQPYKQLQVYIDMKKGNRDKSTTP